MQPEYVQAASPTEEIAIDHSPKKKQRPIDAHVRYVIETRCAEPPKVKGIVHATSADAVSVMLVGTLGQMDAPIPIGKAADCRNYCSFLDAHHQSENDFRVVGRERQNDNSQKWILNSVGKDQPNTYTLQQKLNMQYLDAHTDSGNDYQAVTRGKQDDDSQRWIIEPVAESTPSGDGVLNGLYTIKQKATSMFLDAHIDRKENSVVMRGHQDDDTQRWFIQQVPYQPGTYEIAQKGSCWGRDTDRAQQIAMNYAPIQKPLEKQTLAGRRSGIANYGPILAIQLSKPGGDAWYYGPVTVRYQVLNGNVWVDDVVSNFTKEGWLHNAAVGSSPAASTVVNLWEDGLGERSSRRFEKVVKETWQVIDNRYGSEDFEEKITETVTIRAEDWQQYNSEMENTLELELEARFREEVKADASFGVGAESTSTLDVRTELRNRFRIEARSEEGSRNTRETRVERQVSVKVVPGSLLLKHVVFTASGDTDLYQVGGKYLPVPAASPTVTMHIERIAFEVSANTKRLKYHETQVDEIDQTKITGLGKEISDYHKSIVCRILGPEGCKSLN